MVAYTVRRLIGSVFLAWGVLTLVFLLAEALPGDPFHTVVGPGTSPNAARRLREIFGTERPLHERYVRWLGDLSSGDLGTSLSRRAPVASLVRDRLGNTLLLTVFALLAQFALGIAAGTAAARYRFNRIGRGIELAAGMLYALPTFCTATVLVGIFAVGLRWLPASQIQSIDAASLGTVHGLTDRLRHLLLPTAALALPVAGGLALFVRDQLTETLERPFSLAARARGLRRRTVLLRHALRNALVPLAQLAGLSLPGLIGGAVVIEVVFAWPGMGRLVYEAVLSRDVPLVLGCTLVGGWTVVLGSLVADLLAAIFDPRSRESFR